MSRRPDICFNCDEPQRSRQRTWLEVTTPEADGLPATRAVYHPSACKPRDVHPSATVRRIPVEAA